MRVLLDECLPRQLAPLLTGHQISTVAEQGWTGLANGQLLSTAAAAGFEAFLTADQNLRYQQNLTASTVSTLAVIVLRAKTNRLVDLLPLVPETLDVLGAVRPGEARVVAAAT